MPKKKKEPKPVIPDIPVALYRNIAIGFGGAVLLLVILVLTTATTKAEVKVKPARKAIETAVVLTIGGQGEDAAGGVVVGREATAERIVTPAEGEEAPAKAEGRVKIVNTTGDSITLRPTTRLLSESGVLFRIREYATVPAKGSVEAAIYADEAGKQGEIGPSRFTLPGLSAAQQKLIYAESTAPTTGGMRRQGVVTDADLSREADAAVAGLREQVIKELSAANPEWSGIVVAEVSRKVAEEGEIGVPTTGVTAKVTVKFAVILYDARTADDRSRAALEAERGEGFEVLDATAPEITLDRLDPRGVGSTLKVSRKAIVAPALDHPLLQPENLVGKSPREVEILLKERGVAEEVRVRVSPPWKKRLPGKAGGIEVVIE